MWPLLFVFSDSIVQGFQEEEDSMPTHQMFWRALAVLFIVLLVSGCAPQHTAGSVMPTSTASSTASDIPADATPWDSSSDTLPGQLDLFLSLNIGGYDAATRNMMELNMHFEIEGSIVQFPTGRERISCNGVALTNYRAAFDLKVSSEVFSGKRVTCTYTSGAASANFSFTCPLAPAILSPQEHAQVSHSRRTPVNYRASQDQTFYIIAIGPTTGGMTKAWTPTGTSQLNPAILDTSAFQPGSGSITLVQYLAHSDLRGPDFHSVQWHGDAQYGIEVTWVYSGASKD
jgi:hypothetical protein